MANIKTRVRLIPELDGTEFIEASVTNHRFPLHLHDTFVIQYVDEERNLLKQAARVLECSDAEVARIGLGPLFDRLRSEAQEGSLALFSRSATWAEGGFETEAGGGVFGPVV